jgi:alkanesulfonate monooxygenase SsuD/methylene tetrahydromethanopterin reductase-like flavin-dependent oxidoreductase (luciferase family)
MLRLAGRFGDGWLPGQKVAAAEYRKRLTTIATARAEAGRGSAPFLATQTLLVALGESRARVLEKAMRSPICAALAMGAPVNAATSLQLAAIHGEANRAWMSMIRRLADAGAKLDVADVGGRAPLVFANGTFLAIRPPVAKPEAIELLKKLGAK